MGQAAHLEHYLLLQDHCEVVACSDLDLTRAELVAQRNGIPRAFSNFEQMLSEIDCDGIVASQGFQRHHEWVRDLLPYNKPIFIEKPLAASIPAGEQLLDDIRQAGAQVFIGYHKRSDPASVYAKSLLRTWQDSGEKGTLHHIRVSMPPGDWTQGPYRFRRNIPSQTELSFPEISQPDQIHGETYKRQFLEFVNYYIHQVNLIRFLSGQDYQVTYASRNQRLLIAELEDGSSVCLEMATHSSPIDWQESAECFFDHAWLRLRLPSPMIQLQAGTVETCDLNHQRQDITLSSFPPESAMLCQARNFLNFIRGDYQDNCSVEDAYKDLKVAEQYLAALGVEPGL